MKLGIIGALATWSTQWSTQSQQIARRNAMIACTGCAERRRDRQEVRDYFSEVETESGPSASTDRVLDERMPHDPGVRVARG